MSNAPERPKIEPLTLSLNELGSVIRMAESSIVHAEAADRLYGLDQLIQTRAAASMIQAKCQREIVRIQQENSTSKIVTEPPKKE